MRTLLAIDQGTTSTRAILFDEAARPLASHAVPLRQIYPANGWVEHDAREIWQAVTTVCRTVLRGVAVSDVAAIGIDFGTTNSALALAPAEPNQGRHAWQAFVTYVDPAKAPRPRNDIMAFLQERGISTRPGTHAVHMLGYYRNTYGISADALPASRDCDRHTMAIPLHNRMTEDDYKYVVEAIRQL